MGQKFPGRNTLIVAMLAGCIIHANAFDSSSRQNSPGLFLCKSSLNLRNQRRFLVAYAQSDKPQLHSLAEDLGIKALPVDGTVILGSTGFVVGMVFKKLGKLLVVTVGALGVATNVMERNGFVTIHWDKVHQSITANPTFAQFDKNKDGKMQSSELKDMLSTTQQLVVQALHNNLQNVGAGGAAFGAGVLAGFNLA